MDYIEVKHIAPYETYQARPLNKDGEIRLKDIKSAAECAYQVNVVHRLYDEPEPNLINYNVITEKRKEELVKDVIEQLTKMNRMPKRKKVKHG